MRHGTAAGRDRHSGDGASRSDAAIGASARRLRRGRQDGRGSEPDARRRARVCKRRARSRWCSNRFQPSWRARITAELTIPTIGIGAGPDCDGQVLVSYDAFGLFDRFVPRFVKQYANLGEAIVKGAQEYIEDVQEGRFPGEEHSTRRAGRRQRNGMSRGGEACRGICGRRRARAAPGMRIGLVPTMGALHDGHGALIDRARAECGCVVVTIFVNPIQFDRKDDYERYGRGLPADLEFCRERGVDLVFAPDAAEIYPRPQRVFVDAPALSEYLCGDASPGPLSRRRHGGDQAVQHRAARSRLLRRKGRAATGDHSGAGGRSELADRDRAGPDRAGERRARDQLAQRAARSRGSE